MSAEERVKEAVGDLATASKTVVLRATPMLVEAGSDEARLRALESDVRKLYDGLLATAREIDNLSVGTK